MTTLTSIFQTKLVSQMMIKTDQKKLENFTCFNDAIQSFFDSKMSNTYVRIEGRWNEKTLFDHWSNENDCFKKHKAPFTISWNCSIIVWLSFKDEVWICENYMFLKSFQWNKLCSTNDQSEVSDIGLWFTLLLLLKFFICTHK